MELITFESKAYQELLKKIERIAEYISKVETPVPDEKKEVWLEVIPCFVAVVCIVCPTSNGH